MIKKYTSLFKVILLALMIMVPSVMLGVTPKEMEEARTIAAKSYLRYANDGSGYLDDISPKTMEELEAQLKTKEKENIKAFKAIPVPADYKDWNKEKLVEYWAVTAFQNKGLLEKGRGGRIRARSLINKMTLSSPQTETSSPAPSSPSPQQNTNNPAPQSSPAAVENPDSTLAQISEAQKDINREQEELADLNVNKATNYTWVYIMVLAILVAVVIALVVYAANVMKRKDTRGIENMPFNGGIDPEELEHYKTLVADKETELAMANKKLESAQRQNAELKTTIENLKGEISALKSASAAAVVNKPKEKSVTSSLRSIFLGRANAKGIFVRADRTLNVGNSVFVLETSDGYSGSFRVADSQAAWSLALSNPKEYLETACTGYDLTDTAGASRIVTDTAGTAIFEGGCWRVIRKAKIHYE